MNTIDLNTVLLIKGKKFTIEDFKTKFGIVEDARALQLASTLVKKGKATIYSATSDEDDLLAMLENDIELSNIVNQMDEEEYSSIQAKREEIKQEVDTVNIALSFRTSAEACTAEAWINSIGIEDTEVSIKKGAIRLIVRDITPQEYTKIATKYKLEKAINNTVDVAGKALKGTTNAINYTATNVVAPVAKLAGEAGLNLGKGLVHTGVKVGAGLVNATSRAVEDTKVAMATDAELIRAKKELVDAKDNLVSMFRKRLGSNRRGSGIETL